MAEATNATEATAEVTLTAEEVRAAREIYDRIYAAFQQMWTALYLIDGCRTGKLPETVADYGEVRDMALARGIQVAAEASEHDLTDLAYILHKGAYGQDAVDRIMAKAQKLGSRRVDDG